MTFAASKKALVERFNREPLQGFTAAQPPAGTEGLEVLSVAGSVAVVPWDEVKLVRFIREFQSGKAMPERQAFLTRPKSEGLWVRMQFRDGDVLEGLLPNNLVLLEPHGFSAAPPDLTGNTQRVFVPRQALSSLQVLGVIGSPLRSKRAAEAKKQIGLFDGT